MKRDSSIDRPDGHQAYASLFVLALASFLLIGVFGGCGHEPASNGIGNGNDENDYVENSTGDPTPEPGREMDFVSLSYEIEGRLFTISEESEPRPAVGEEVSLWIDLAGDGDLRAPKKLSTTTDGDGRFAIETGKLEIPEEQMPPKALLVASVDGHTTSYKSLDPNAPLWIDINLYPYEEMSLGPLASLPDGSLVIENLPDEVARAWARLLHPLDEADGFASGHQGEDEPLLSFAAVGDVLLIGEGGEPFSSLPEPATLRMELPHSVWSSLVVFSSDRDELIWPDDIFIWPDDIFIWPDDIFHSHEGSLNNNAIFVPMLAFDPTLGSWNPKATGYLTDIEGEPLTREQLPDIWEGSHTDRLFVSADVEHFSQWAYGWPVARGCIEGTLFNKDGFTWTHATITGQVVGTGDLAGPVVTNESGAFCLPVPGIMGSDQPRVMRLFATAGGERVELESVQIQPQESPVLSCCDDEECQSGDEECQSVGDVWPRESESTADCRIELLFPNRTWPDNPLDLEVEVLGSGFEDGARLVWNIEGEIEGEEVEPVRLDTIFRDEGLLVAHLPSDLFQWEDVKVAVSQADGLCENRKTFYFDTGVLPDTGQTLCYNAREAMDECPAESADFYGQDAQFGWDRALTQQSDRFDNRPLPDHEEEPIAVDEMARLRWQGCVAGLSGPDCQTGEPLLLTRDEAISYCERLSWGGYSDHWTLPDIRQLATLVNRGRSEPSAYTNIFPNMYIEDIAYRFWSSSSDASSLGDADSPRAWYVDFIDGYIDTADPDREQRAVLCMGDRALPAPAFDRRIPALNEPVVRDSSTGLMWQGCSGGQSGEACEGDAENFGSWEQALEHCNTSDWGGHSDWRLPSIKELQSIVDYGRYSPSIDSVNFPNTMVDDLYWSSTTKAGEPYKAWAIEYDVGKVQALVKEQSMALVRCTRAGPVP